jgi:hypothetical protein
MYGRGRSRLLMLVPLLLLTAVSAPALGAVGDLYVVSGANCAPSSLYLVDPADGSAILLGRSPWTRSRSPT